MGIELNFDDLNPGAAAGKLAGEPAPGPGAGEPVAGEDFLTRVERTLETINRIIEQVKDLQSKGGLALPLGESKEQDFMFSPDRQPPDSRSQAAKTPAEPGLTIEQVEAHFKGKLIDYLNLASKNGFGDKSIFELLESDLGKITLDQIRGLLK